MARILRNLAPTILLAVLLLVVVAYGFHSDEWTSSTYAVAMLGLLQQLAIILWIGWLFAFNFIIQPRRPLGVFEGMADRLLIEALHWSRYAAIFAVAIGLLLAWLDPALDPGLGSNGDAGLMDTLLLRGDARVGGFGLWLMILMALNLWLFIWPLQKRALGVVEAQSDIRMNAAIVATIFSRINLMLALPMLYCLATAGLVDTPF